MTKDLSRQLCELAGIEPVYSLYVNFGDLDYNYQKVWNKRKYRLIADYRWQVNDIRLRNLTQEYPNFETPENFVKLLECLFQFPFVCKEKETYIKSILCGTIKKLENEECEELKQLLKTTEFIY